MLFSIAPENWWLEDEMSYFRGELLVSGRVFTGGRNCNPWVVHVPSLKCRLAISGISRYLTSSLGTRSYEIISQDDVAIISMKIVDHQKIAKTIQNIL